MDALNLTHIHYPLAKTKIYMHMHAPMCELVYSCSFVLLCAAFVYAFVCAYAFACVCACAVFAFYLIVGNFIAQNVFSVLLSDFFNELFLN